MPKDVMESHIDIESWKTNGEELWKHIQDNGFMSLGWCNPWFRLLLFGLSVMTVAALCQLLLGLWYLSLLIAAYGFFILYKSILYLIIDNKIGGLYFYYSKEGFRIGGAFEAIEIPYSAMELPETISPSTVNSNYIDLPVPPEYFHMISVCKPDESKSQWDQQPYKQAIAMVALKKDKLIVKANPNEFIVHIFSTLYPLLLYLKAEKSKIEN